jgi:hypothetical protein
MTQPPGTQPAPRRTPLSADEKARAELNFSPYVAQALATRGRFRVSADTPEMIELFQQVARRVGDELGRPVVSYANGREIVIAFAEEPPDRTGQTLGRFTPSARNLTQELLTDDAELNRAGRAGTR